MDKLSEMRAFQAVAEAGGFTAAAGQLRVSQSLVSRAIARLERRLGTMLLHRSTRRVSLTDEGVIFLQGCRRVLEDIDEVERSVTARKSPLGILRISASLLFGQDPIVSLLPEFMARYPKLEVQLSLTDRHVDLIEEKIDVAIRLGPLTNTSLIARKLGAQRRLIVASPDYLAQRGRPKKPADLLDHNCLLWDEGHENLNRWPFEVNGATHHLKVRGRLAVNNAEALLHLAILGGGISRMSAHRAHPLIRRGELVSLLEASHRDEAAPVHALYVRTNIAKPRVRAFLDFLTEKFSSDSYKDAETRSARCPQAGRASDVHPLKRWLVAAMSCACLELRHATSGLSDRHDHCSICTVAYKSTNGYSRLSSVSFLRRRRLRDTHAFGRDVARTPAAIRTMLWAIATRPRPSCKARLGDALLWKIPVQPFRRSRF